MHNLWARELVFTCLLEDNVTYGKSIEDEHLSDGFNLYDRMNGNNHFSFTFPSSHYIFLKHLTGH